MPSRCHDTNIRVIIAGGHKTLPYLWPESGLIPRIITTAEGNV